VGERELYWWVRESYTGGGERVILVGERELYWWVRVILVGERVILVGESYTGG